MGEHASSLIFISHASDDEKLAGLLQRLLESSLNLNAQREAVFRSSDIESIGMYEVQYHKITEAHRSAKAVIALLTPNSIYRPWVLFETGGAHFFGSRSASDSKQLFLVLANGITPASLPAPLRPRQARDLSDLNVIRRLCEEVAAQLQRSEYFEIDEDLVRRVNNEAALGTNGWEFVQQALVAERISKSPFGFEKLLDEMKETMFIAGQNLFFLTRDDNKEKHRNLVFQKVSQGKTVQMMVCNPNYEHAVKTWQAATAPRYATDLGHSTEVFKQWVQEANSMHLSGTLDIRMTVIVPLGITFVDAHLPSGKLVFAPAIYQRIGALRPCFLLSRKQHSYVFDYYYEACQDVFTDRNITTPIVAL